MRPRRLLTISHSYIVALNRRLAAELSRAGDGDWLVTAVAPRRYHGDLRDITLEQMPEEPNALRPVDAYGTRSAHLFFYDPSLARVLGEGWDVVHAWEEPFVVAGAQIAAWTPRDVPFVISTAQNIRKRYPPPFCPVRTVRAPAFQRVDCLRADDCAGARGFAGLPGSPLRRDPSRGRRGGVST